MGCKRPESQKMNKEEGKIRALNVGRLDTLRQNIHNGKESVGNCSLNDL
jgi:hypothetical protein